MPTADYSSFKQPANTAADGTKFGNLIDAIQATVNGIDTNNLAAAAGVKAAQLADPTTGKVLGSSGSACAAVFPPGYTYAYNEYTAPVNITHTTEATADTLATATAVTFNGTTTVDIEFFCLDIVVPGSAQLDLWLYDGASSIGRIGRLGMSNVGGIQIETPVKVGRRLTPSAAPHTYSVRSSIGSGTGTARAGAGGVGVDLPGYIKITQA